MDQSITKVLEVLRDLFQFDVTKRIFFLVGVTLSVVLGISLYHWVQSPIYAPLPYYVDGDNLSAIMQELDKGGILYKVNEYNHTVSVPVNDLEKAKLNLSIAGVSKDNVFSLAYLNDSNQFGSSQFLENARYVHALEADLARTISKIQGVNAAKVHLAIPQRNIFSDENTKPSASVMVNFTPGYEHDKEIIKSIIQLIAASVPGLEPRSVVITNQYGHYLSSILNQDSYLNQEELDYQNSLQMYYERRIKSLISPMVGINKASISVNIDLDFTQQEEAKEAFDPNQTTVRSEQTLSENTSSANASGVPGALSNQAPTNKEQNNQNSPQTGQSRSQSIKNYEVSKSMQYKKSSTPKIKTISVAVIVDEDMVLDKKTNKMVPKPLSQDKLDKLTELVKSTIGFNSKRGDQVTVVNSVFKSEKIETPTQIPFWEKPLFLEWSKQILGVILGFLFLLLIYKKFIASFKPKEAKMVPSLALGITGEHQITPEMMHLKEEQIKLLKDLVLKDPNKVANIIKKWIAN
ncbi:hypothetical protein EP47_05010 [Legionella norrlandica]|uniref:Flagellar M-ring protein n=1 Tax=Legionella norrlandica TaxID=1498499 RepID=A0A0A2SW94_9GAMM|nr:flagellar basal-body MS-ring/collar protein FliF [Legionella norrlandica]KGP63724.1 hypothetical protein EP47_05010 [Legionella norrlandica]